MDKILNVESIDDQQLRPSEYYGYVYLTRNLINGKMYVGCHKSSKVDPSYYGSGKLLHYAIKKYGLENFSVEILKWCKTKDDLFNSEREIIESLDCVNSDDYYNIASGGHGGDTKSGLDPVSHERFINKSRESNTGRIRSEESKRNMSNNHADFNGDKNPFYGKKHSDVTKEKISKNNARAHKGKYWITDKVSNEVLVSKEDICKYPNYVRGRLRRNQRKVKFND